MSGRLTLSDGTAGDGRMTIDSNVGGEAVSFANPTGSLTIDAGLGLKGRFYQPRPKAWECRPRRYCLRGLTQAFGLG